MLGTIKQRRTITVVFYDLNESTKLAETMELEAYEAFLQDIHLNTEAIFKQHGGTIVRVDGDGAMAIFGYPEPHEDAAKRAINASLELNKWILEFSNQHTYTRADIALHTGINSGIVLLKEGDLARGRYEILGDTTNVAARLSDLAGPGEIVISIDALGSDRHFFETTRPELMEIRSRRQKKFICKVLAQRNTEQLVTANVRHNSHQLIGRQHIIDQLESFLFRRIPEKIVVAKAEAGMGKSRLLSEMVRVATKLNYCIVWSYCRSYRGGSQLSPVRHILKSLFDAASSASNQYGDITETLKVSGDAISDLRPEDLVPAFQKLLSCLRDTYQQTVIFLDDWHWADDSSRAFLDQIARLNIKGLLIVVAERFTHEPLALGISNLLIELRALPDGEAARLVESIEPSLNQLTIEDIVARAGGNPLYLEELSYASRLNLVASDELQSDAWLHTLIQSRFDLLEPDEKSILQLASAIGHIVPKWILSEVANMSASAPIFTTLARKDFLHQGSQIDSWRFKHGLTAEAIYSQIPGPDKVNINAQIAECLSANLSHADPGDLARHHFRAMNIDQGVNYSVKAGNAALSDTALDKAQFHFRTALEGAVEAKLSEEEIVHSLKKYGQVCIVDPSWKMARTLASLEKEFLKNNFPTAALWAGYFLAFIRYGLGQLNQSIDKFQSVQVSARKIGLETIVIRVDATLGQVYAAACRGWSAMPVLEKSMQLQRDRLPRTSVKSAIAYTVGSKAHLLMDMGHFDEAQDLFDEIAGEIETATENGNLSAASFLGAALITRGDFKKAKDIFSGTSKLAEDMRSHFHLAQSGTFLGLAEFKLTLDVRKLEAMQTFTERWAMKSDHHLSIPYGYLAEYLGQLGRFDQSLHYAGLALERASEGDRFGETMAYRAQALNAYHNADEEALTDAFRNAYYSARIRDSERALCLTGYLEQEMLNSAQVDWAAISKNRGIDPATFFLPKSNSGLR